MPVQATLPLEEAACAQEMLQHGHVRGKLVLTVACGVTEGGILNIELFRMPPVTAYEGRRPLQLPRGHYARAVSSTGTMGFKWVSMNWRSDSRNGGSESRSPSVAASSSHDATHDAFMTLPPHTRTREGEDLSWVEARNPACWACSLGNTLEVYVSHFVQRKQYPFLIESKEYLCYQCV